METDGKKQGEHPTVAYLAEALGKTPVLAETLSLSSEEETEYLAWSFGNCEEQGEICLNGDYEIEESQTDE